MHKVSKNKAQGYCAPLIWKIKRIHDTPAKTDGSNYIKQSHYAQTGLKMSGLDKTLQFASEILSSSTVNLQTYNIHCLSNMKLYTP